MSNGIVIANIEKGNTTKEIFGVWQYDYGQVLRIQGIDLPSAVEVDFSLEETGVDSIPLIGITKDGVTEVPIPDSLLKNNDTTTGYKIYAYIFISDETSGRTEYKITIHVKTRTKLGTPVEANPEEPDPFRGAVQAVQKAAESAAESEKQVREDKENVEKTVREFALAAQKAITAVDSEGKKQIEEMQTAGGKIAEEVKENVKTAEKIKTSLEIATEEAKKTKAALTGAITESGTAITKVNEAIKIAGIAKEEAETATVETNKATETANTVKTELDDSATKANELKIALEKSIGEVAKDETGLLILTVLQKGSDLLGQIAKVVEETAGKAGSLNGFGLNLLEDGSVALTYTNPETNLLEASAIFPKDSTAKKLDKVLGEMNEQLKVITLREGGKA